MCDANQVTKSSVPLNFVGRRYHRNMARYFFSISERRQVKETVSLKIFRHEHEFIHFPFVCMFAPQFNVEFLVFTAILIEDYFTLEIVYSLNLYSIFHYNWEINGNVFWKPLGLCLALRVIYRQMIFNF